MKLPDEPTEGNVTLQDLRLLIYGPPKIGKTTLASGFPNALFLATEKGYARFKVHVIDITSWIKFQEAVNLITTSKHKFKFIVIDTLDVLFSLCVSSVCLKLKIDHLSDEDYGKGYDMAAKEFEKWINKLFIAPYGFIGISHTKINEIFSRSGKISKIVPTLPNQARKIIIPKVSTIGYMDMAPFEVKPGKFRERHVISFEPSEMLEAGDRDGRLPQKFVVPKDPEETYRIFKDAYSQKRKEGG